jgi:hypothetical protein
MTRPGKHGQRFERGRFARVGCQLKQAVDQDGAEQLRRAALGIEDLTGSPCFLARGRPGPQLSTVNPVPCLSQISDGITLPGQKQAAAPGPSRRLRRPGGRSRPCGRPDRKRAPWRGRGRRSGPRSRGSPSGTPAREPRVDGARPGGVVEPELGERAGPLGRDRAKAEQLADCGPRLARFAGPADVADDLGVDGELASERPHVLRRWEAAAARSPSLLLRSDSLGCCYSGFPRESSRRGDRGSPPALSLFFNLPICDVGVSYVFCRVVPACRGA